MFKVWIPELRQTENGQHVKNDGPGPKGEKTGSSTDREPPATSMVL